MVAKTEEVVSSKLDTFKLLLAIAVLIAGIVGFYYYEAESLQGIAVPLTAYDIPCLRLTSFVRTTSGAPPEAQDSVHGRELDLP